MRPGIWRTRGNGGKPICPWRTAGTSASPTNRIESRRVARTGDLLLGRFGRGGGGGALRRKGFGIPSGVHPEWVFVKWRAVAGLSHPPTFSVEGVGGGKSFARLGTDQGGTG